jgi:hypothetical protein
MIPRSKVQPSEMGAGAGAVRNHVQVVQYWTLVHEQACPVQSYTIDRHRHPMSDKYTHFIPTRHTLWIDRIASLRIDFFSSLRFDCFPLLSACLLLSNWFRFGSVRFAPWCEEMVSVSGYNEWWARARLDLLS